MSIQGRPRAHWRDYISRLAWERLGIPPAELGEVVRARMSINFLPEASTCHPVMVVLGTPSPKANCSSMPNIIPNGEPIMGLYTWPGPLPWSSAWSWEYWHPPDGEPLPTVPGQS